MKITNVNCPQSKYAIKCPYSMTPEYITVHNTYNDASAMSEVSYMIGNGNKTSFHAAVDNERVVTGIPFNRNAWHAGDGRNGKGNRKSIGIEICYSKSGGARFDAAEKLAAEYVAYLLKQYGWGIERVKKHQDWSGKYCPHRTLDRGWQRFLNMVKEHLGGKPTPQPTPKPGTKYTPGSYQVNTDTLNVRKKANASSKIVAKIHMGSKQGVDKVDGDWGHLMNNAGWINLNYCKKITTPNSSSKYTPGSYQVTSKDLNVRKGPGTNYGIVTVLKKGSKQGIDKTDDNWRTSYERCRLVMSRLL